MDEDEEQKNFLSESSLKEVVNTDSRNMTYLFNEYQNFLMELKLCSADYDELSQCIDQLLLLDKREVYIFLHKICDIIKDSSKSSDSVEIEKRFRGLRLCDKSDSLFQVWKSLTKCNSSIISLKLYHLVLQNFWTDIDFTKIFCDDSSSKHEHEMYHWY